MTSWEDRDPGAEDDNMLRTTIPGIRNTLLFISVVMIARTMPKCERFAQATMFSSLSIIFTIFTSRLLFSLEVFFRFVWVQVDEGTASLPGPVLHALIPPSGSAAMNSRPGIAFTGGRPGRSDNIAADEILGTRSRIKKFESCPEFRLFPRRPGREV